MNNKYFPDLIRKIHQITSSKIIRLSFIIFFTLSPFSGSAVVTLPKLISNGMVLQRDKPIKIWGWASPLEKIKIQFNGVKHHTEANPEGKWSLTLPAMKAGGPHLMTINGDNEIILKDILIGEVWLCSGQSNMEFTVNGAKHIYQKEIANAENPKIRQFLVKQQWSFLEQQDTEPSTWVAANPTSILGFTAVGYFFALEFYNKYQIPIGLIHASSGGTPAESWMSDSALEAFPNYKRKAVLFKDPLVVKNIRNKDDSIRKAWFDQVKQLDKGFADKNKSWYNNTLEFASWPIFNIPGLWQNQSTKKTGAVMWLKKTLTLTKAQSLKAAYVELGNIEEQDTTYLNGVRIGTTNNRHAPRKYMIPKGLLREGENIFTLRILDTDLPGGFIDGKPYQLVLENEILPLNGAWKYNIGVELPSLQNATFTNFSYQPTAWYNSKIVPILPYQIKGVLWYQGEGNVNRAKEYQTLFPALINNWRQQFNQGEFPFLFVQLANLGAADAQPADHSLQRLREAQTGTLALANTGMAVTHDIGEWNDIHPLNKKEVGRRLFMSAERVAYGNPTKSNAGPIFKSFKIDGDKILIYFADTGNGLYAKDKQELRHFALAGPDGKFAWAKAQITGKNTVTVSSNDLPNPIYVRYAWARNPEGANLYGADNLPVSSFRTDKFDQ